MNNSKKKIINLYYKMSINKKDFENFLKLEGVKLKISEKVFNEALTILKKKIKNINNSENDNKNNNNKKLKYIENGSKYSNLSKKKINYFEK